MKSTFRLIVFAICGLSLTGHSSELSQHLLKEREKVEDVHVLEDSYADKTKKGFTFDEALQRCRELRNSYKNTYFLVTCKFYNKRWTEFERRTGYRTEYETIGYKSLSIHKYSEYESVVEVDGVYTRKYSSYELDYDEYEPITRAYSVSFTYNAEIAKSRTGLKVLGVGRLKDLNTKLVFSSKDVLGKATFKTRPKALRACLIMKTTNETQTLKYYNSDCVVKPDGDLFFYEVHTKNPFYAGVQ